MANKERVQFDFSPEMLSSIDSIKERTGASTRAEVIRQALVAFGYFADLDPEQKVEVKNPQGEIIFLGKARLLNR